MHIFYTFITDFRTRNPVLKGLSVQSGSWRGFGEDHLMPETGEELFQIPLSPQPPAILPPYYNQRMRSHNFAQRVALIATQAELNPNFFLHNPPFAHEPIKLSFQKDDRNWRPVQWELPRNDLYCDQSDLRSQVCGQARCGTQSSNRSCFSCGDDIHSQLRSAPTCSASSTVRGVRELTFPRLTPQRRFTLRHRSPPPSRLCSSSRVTCAY